MECQVCYGEVHDEPDGTLPLQASRAVLAWIECVCCNQIVCCHCCRHPGTKLCDPCLAQHKLASDLITLALLEEEYDDEIASHIG